MNLQFTKEELDFQKEVRDWIKDNYPEDMKDRLMNSPNGHVTKEEHVKWQQASKGLDEKNKAWVAAWKHKESK